MLEYSYALISSGLLWLSNLILTRVLRSMHYNYKIILAECIHDFGNSLYEALRIYL